MRSENHTERVTGDIVAEWDNSTLIDRKALTPDLAIFRVQPDARLFDFEPGQYTVIGLPHAAPRCASADPDEDAGADPDALIRRAYSIASSSLEREYVELYVTLVPSGALTPRLWVLEPGDRLWLGPKATGQFTMDAVPADMNLVMFGTGTGLAPYMSMIRQHHQCNIGRMFVLVHGARYTRELGYREDLTQLDSDCRTFAYLPTVSRPEREAEWTGHRGRIQSVLRDGALETALGRPLTSDATHAFVCGNPEMVEDVQRILLQKGYTLHRKREPGTLHVERYW